MGATKVSERNPSTSPGGILYIWMEKTCAWEE